MSAPIRRRRDGRYAVKLDPGVRALLVTMSEQLAPVLGPDEPMTRRLFPPAYPGQTEERAESEYRALVDSALVNHHRQAFAVVAATADADTLTEPELNAWLSAVGSMRLVLGTRLDVSEDMAPPDPEDPTAPEYALYELLGQLQYLLIEALAAGLPDEGRPEGDL
ncbi:MAG TPA: DUF2017 family protein [Acidimicrobiales bacterium]|nr:DUF2017 family protein [Acidimicrobiales bacterium]